MSKQTLVLGPSKAGMELSREEFGSAEFQAPYTYERVKGKLAVMTPAGPEHRKMSRPFRRELGAYWASHRDRVDDVDVEGWVATSSSDDRLPDICVYLAGESSVREVPDRVPDLIFEFVSEGPADQERDYVTKRAEYHAIGVREYVIVDRFRRTVLVLAWQEDDFSERLLPADDMYTTPLLPGLSVSLREAFE